MNIWDTPFSKVQSQWMLLTNPLCPVTLRNLSWWDSGLACNMMSTTRPFHRHCSIALDNVMSKNICEW